MASSPPPPPLLSPRAFAPELGAPLEWSGALSFELVWVILAVVAVWEALVDACQIICDAWGGKRREDMRILSVRVLARTVSIVGLIVGTQYAFLSTTRSCTVDAALIELLEGVAFISVCVCIVLTVTSLLDWRALGYIISFLCLGIGSIQIATTIMTWAVNDDGSACMLNAAERWHHPVLEGLKIVAIVVCFLPVALTAAPTDDDGAFGTRRRKSLIAILGLLAVYVAMLCWLQLATDGTTRLLPLSLSLGAGTILACRLTLLAARPVVKAAGKSYAALGKDGVHDISKTHSISIYDAGSYNGPLSPGQPEPSGHMLNPGSRASPSRPESFASISGLWAKKRQSLATPSSFVPLREVPSASAEQGGNAVSSLKPWTDGTRAVQKSISFADEQEPVKVISTSLSRQPSNKDPFSSTTPYRTFNKTDPDYFDELQPSDSISHVGDADDKEKDRDWVRPSLAPIAEGRDTPLSSSYHGEVARSHDDIVVPILRHHASHGTLGSGKFRSSGVTRDSSALEAGSFPYSNHLSSGHYSIAAISTASALTPAGPTMTQPAVAITVPPRPKSPSKSVLRFVGELAASARQHVSGRPSQDGVNPFGAPVGYIAKSRSHEDLAQAR